MGVDFGPDEGAKKEDKDLQGDWWDELDPVRPAVSLRAALIDKIQENSPRFRPLDAIAATSNGESDEAVRLICQHRETAQKYLRGVVRGCKIPNSVYPDPVLDGIQLREVDRQHELLSVFDLRATPSGDSIALLVTPSINDSVSKPEHERAALGASSPRPSVPYQPFLLRPGSVLYGIETTTGGFVSERIFIHPLELQRQIQIFADSEPENRVECFLTGCIRSTLAMYAIKLNEFRICDVRIANEISCWTIQTPEARWSFSIRLTDDWTLISALVAA